MYAYNGRILTHFIFQGKGAPTIESRTLQRLIANNAVRVKIADLGNACFEVLYPNSICSQRPHSH